ncbi:hypothetical protein K440DRAFT_671254 [Wilcoxina mikolae CBS 423.85]|nr:hypothetical protein K440DRAFT_671254 [Wilcoxina mikolae CBS 423.85]
MSESGPVLLGSTPVKVLTMLPNEVEVLQAKPQVVTSVYWLNKEECFHCYLTMISTFPTKFPAEASYQYSINSPDPGPEWVDFRGYYKGGADNGPFQRRSCQQEEAERNSSDNQGDRGGESSRNHNSGSGEDSSGRSRDPSGGGSGGGGGGGGGGGPADSEQWHFSTSFLERAGPS